MSIKRVNAGPRMSSAVVHGDTVYLAGLTADDAKADVKGQTKQILDKMAAITGLPSPTVKIPFAVAATYPQADDSGGAGGGGKQVDDRGFNRAGVELDVGQGAQ